MSGNLTILEDGRAELECGVCSKKEVFDSQDDAFDAKGWWPYEAYYKGQEQSEKLDPVCSDHELDLSNIENGIIYVVKP